MRDKTRFLLIVLDGWGIGDKSHSDAIYNANTPYLDSLVAKYPHSQLITSGESVGLPDGQMGNSEVGHFTLGAGRVVYQELVRINKAVDDNSFDSNPMLLEAFRITETSGKKLHLIGLVSDGGVHSHLNHLVRICELAEKHNLINVFIHALTDGRDTDPHSGIHFINTLEEKIKETNVKIASLAGRYYTMDRDKRWERIQQGYNLLVHGEGKKTASIVKAIQESYDEGITDEFIKPVAVVDTQNRPLATIDEGDIVICFNFRTDRLREITTVLTQKDMPEFSMKTIELEYFTMTRYDESFRNIKVIFENENVENSLGEIFSRLGLKQLRIAETEKYPHVTFFFSGGREDAFINENRIMVPSPKVPTYDLKPEMSAFLVKDKVVEEINRKEQDFICLNFANGDMVGHTGVYPSIIKAVEAVDICVGEVVEAAQKNNYEVLIIADHGNADHAVNPDGSPNTAHSLNPVPCIFVTNRYRSIRNGTLADIAPTILTAMGIDIPGQMQGKVLIEQY